MSAAALTPRQQFQAAILAEHLEELRGRVGAGLVRCGSCWRRARYAGVWFPTDEISRQLGAPEGKSRCVVYAWCGKCSDAAVETAALARFAGEAPP